MNNNVYYYYIIDLFQSTLCTCTVLHTYNILPYFLFHIYAKCIEPLSAINLFEDWVASNVKERQWFDQKPQRYPIESHKF